MTGRLRHWITEARRRRADKAFILMYHRVAAEDCDPWDLCVSPERFEDQLRCLARDYRVVALTELLAEHLNRRLSDGTVAITFDDGYADNLHAAAPLLVRHGLPATFFVTSGAIGSPREFWWDRLEKCLLVAGPLPDRLQIPVAGSEKSWDLGAARAGFDRSVRGARPWEADPTTRLGFFYEIWKYLRGLDELLREEALTAVERWSGAGDETRPTHRILSPVEVRELADLPGMTIGAHSVSHATLSACNPSAQRLEIRRSKDDLERLLGRRVPMFAYPFGDFGPETPGMVRETGYDGACIADPGAVWTDTDPFQLPRVAVLDWDAAEFGRQIAHARQ